jgi:hypothetical protein
LQTYTPCTMLGTPRRKVNTLSMCSLGKVLVDQLSPLPSLGSTAAVHESSSMPWKQLLRTLVHPSTLPHHASLGLVAAASAAATAVTAGRGVTGMVPVSLQQLGQLHMRRHMGSGRDGYTHFEHRGRRYYRLSGRTGTLLGLIATGGMVVWVRSREEVPYTHRRHSILVSPIQEHALGTATYAEVLAKARADGTLLPRTHPAVRAVEHVGTRIAKKAEDGFGGGFNGHMKGLQWDFAVINSPEPNAFVVPGGKVGVFPTGLGITDA